MIKLYHAPRSRSARIVWLLEELQLPYELVTVGFTHKELKRPEYLRIHPLGRVPAIEDEGLILFESGAIVEYLCEKYGGGRLAPSPGSKLRGPWLQWIHFAEATAMPPLSDIAQHTILRPESERLAAVADDARARVGAMLAQLDRELAGRTYLVGDGFSAADVMTGYSLTLAKWFGLLTDEYPEVAAYLARLEQRPAFQKALG